MLDSKYLITAGKRNFVERCLAYQCVVVEQAYFGIRVRSVAADRYGDVEFLV